jgi:hypothetical protein
LNIHNNLLTCAGFSLSDDIDETMAIILPLHNGAARCLNRGAANTQMLSSFVALLTIYRIGEGHARVQQKNDTDGEEF